MKKFVWIFCLFFWSMIFPQLSLNHFTTEIVSKDVEYADLFDKNSRKELLQNATFSCKIVEFFAK